MEQPRDFPQRFYLTCRCVVWDLPQGWLVSACMTTLGRLACVVPFCRRTTARADFDEWICGDHWRLIDKVLRQVYGRHLRRRRRYGAAAYGPAAARIQAVERAAASGERSSTKLARRATARPGRGLMGQIPPRRNGGLGKKIGGQVKLSGLKIAHARGQYYVYLRATGETLLKGFDGEGGAAAQALHAGHARCL